MRDALAVLVLAASLGALGCGEREVARSSGCRPGTLDAVRGEHREITVAGETRSYLLDVPRGAADEPRAVVLAFHGFGARGRRLRRWSNLGRIAHRRGFIAVFPTGRDDVTVGERVGRGWDGDPAATRDRTFVEAVLDEVERTWCVDPRRVYATGMSNGARFTHALGCVLADRLAGIALVAGATPLGECRPARPIPVLLIHGRSDRIVPVAQARAARDWWVTHNGCGEGRAEMHCRHFEACTGAPVSYCEAGQRHVWPRPAARRIVDFFGIPRPVRRRAAPGSGSAPRGPSTTAQSP